MPEGMSWTRKIVLALLGANFNLLSFTFAQNNDSYGFLPESSFLVSYFTFNAGQFLLDSTGHENLNPSGNPPTQSTNCYFDNGCAQFNSTLYNSFNLTSFQYQPSFSVCFWFYSLSFSGITRVLLDYGNGADLNEIYIALDPTRAILVYLRQGANKVTFFTGGNLITFNTWNHLCVVRTAPTPSNTAESWRIYVNGSNTGYTATAYTNFPDLPNVNLSYNFIGQPIGPALSRSDRNNNKLSFFNGKLDEFRWYNTAVSSSDVSALFEYYRCILKQAYDDHAIITPLPGNVRASLR